MQAAEKTASEVSAIRADEDFDHARLADYLKQNIPELSGEIEILQFPGGHSNLTYLARIGGKELVVRRPPLGPVAPTAHDMGREFRVLSKLCPVFPPAPRAYLYCEDESVIGAKFLVMERRNGIIIRNQWPPELPDDPALRRRISESMADTLATLHTLDYNAAGLGDFGKPDGFVERQVKGWAGRWEKAKTREISGVDQILAWLNEKMPTSGAPSLIHNDFKLDNVALDPADPGRIASIFDWEMSALGDPLVDLGTTLAYWAHVYIPGQDGRRLLPTQTPGFFTRDQFVARYGEKTGYDLSKLGWYEAFALYKNAVVLEQIYVRFVRGQTKDKRFELLGYLVEPLIKKAMELAKQSGL